MSRLILKKSGKNFTKSGFVGVEFKVDKKETAGN